MVWRRSITIRLTPLFTAASTVVLLAVGILIGLVVESHFEEQDLAEFEGKLELTRHALAKAYTTAELHVLPQQLADALIGHPGLSVIVTNPENQILFLTDSTEFTTTIVDRLLPTALSHPSKPHI